MDETDVVLPNTLKNFLNQLLRILGTLFIVTYTFPLIIVAVIPLTLGVWWVLKTYLTTSRLLRRFSAAAMAVVNGHVSETICGVSTIRAYKIQTQMIDDCMRSIDDYQTYYYMEMVSDCWLFLRLQVLTSLFIAVLSLAIVANRDSMGASMAGLSLTSAITIMQDVFLFTRYAAALEKAMISVERIREYEEIVQEKMIKAPSGNALDRDVLDDKLLTNNRGQLRFDHVTSRYPVRGDIILRGVTVTIHPGQHVAVVGRTGAGKSSLVLSMFRMLETVEGSIFIDGYDISHIELGRHRSRINIIPQEMALFAGTLRFNLDPMDHFTDTQIWDCIRGFDMLDFVEKLPNGLDTFIETGGVGLSNGEKQVITCIRGLLHEARIVVLDEATSALGARMEERMTRAFDTRFQNSTVLIITHNIEKTLNCDKILVLDGGKLKEYDSPDVLLSNNRSAFYAMARDSGLV